jgi:hypothetical protein
MTCNSTGGAIHREDETTSRVERKSSGLIVDVGKLVSKAICHGATRVLLWSLSSGRAWNSEYYSETVIGIKHC